MGGQYGIEKLKQLLDLGFVTGQIIKAATADGKINLNDLTLLLAFVPKLGPAMENIAIAPKEYSELDAEDGAALLAYGKTKVGNISDAALKDIVGASLLVGLGAGRLLSALTLLQKSQP